MTAARCDYASTVTLQYVQRCLRIFLFISVIGFMVALGGCTGDTDTRGALVQTAHVSTVQPGVHRKEDVAALLGTPSTIGTFDDDIWYYIGSRTHRLAFFAPDVVEQKVTVVRFDSDGTVESIGLFDKTAARDIVMVSRETPTAGHSLTFIEQLIGNIGRFNKNNGPTASAPR